MKALTYLTVCLLMPVVAVAIADHPPSMVVTIDANSESWVSTGIVFSSNTEAVVVNALGWARNETGPEWEDADGKGECQDTNSPVCENCPIGSLIGRIGGGTPFNIGQNEAFSPTGETGELELLYNDVPSNYGDNSGSFEVLLYFIAAPVFVDAPENTPESISSVRLTLAPNPFSRSVSFNVDVGETANVQVRVFDVAGRLVRELLDRRLSRGQHVIQWDRRDQKGQSVAAGAYFATVADGKNTYQRSMIVLD